MKTSFLSLLFVVLTACGVYAQGVRPGDTIELRLSGVPSEDALPFNGSFSIDNDGMINLPLINKVKVGGMLPNQIQETIQTRLVEEKIFTHPTITILQNQSRFVDVTGEVKAPQRVNYTADMTLQSAIAAAGWFTDYANQSKIRLTRDNKTTVYSMKEIRNNPSLDPKVSPGDKILVPQSMF